MTIKAIRLHVRDLGLLTEIAEVGILDVATIWRRHFPADRTGKACLRRLRLLCAHELLQVIVVSVAFAMERCGRPRRMFRLTPRGAEVLEALTGRTGFHVGRKEPRPETLEHRLGIAKLRLTVNDACGLHQLPSPHWISEYDTVPGIPLEAKLTERFILCEKLPTQDGRLVSCWPDASCHLRISHPSGTGEVHLLLYWEYDRSTETLDQVAKKVPGYSALLSSGAYQKHWPNLASPAVRVFFVTQSEERLRNVGKAIRELRGADAFRLAIVDDLTPQRFFTDPIWKTVAGEARPILRTPPLKS